MTDPPHWSRWFRQVDAEVTRAQRSCTGADDKPLLVLSREGEGPGRAPLSDQMWLWARGFEGGGPHLDLLRRLAHWLMKEPDSRRRRLRITVRGRDLTVQRQTMSDMVDEVTLTAPSGKTRTLSLSATEPGVWRSTVEVNELGLWRATDGTLNALANVGPPNPREFTEVTSTRRCWPLARSTGGGAVRVGGCGVGPSTSEDCRIRSSDTFTGDDWLGLRIREVDRRAWHRRVAGIRRADRAPSPDREPRRNLDARRPLTWSPRSHSPSRFPRPSSRRSLGSARKTR